MNSELNLQDKLSKAASLQSARAGGQKFVSNLSTQSFVSIFHHIQQQNSQGPQQANQTFSLPFNPQRTAVDIAESLDEKQQKSGAAFDARVERQKEKQLARAEDYDPQKFQDTFLGTMIALMEAQQNEREKPLFSSEQNSQKSGGSDFVNAVEQSLIKTKPSDPSDSSQAPHNLAPNSPSLRLVIDGIPAQNNQNPTESFKSKDLSEQDVAISYIFAGRQFLQNNQQLRSITDAQMDQKPSPQNQQDLSVSAA